VTRADDRERDLETGLARRREILGPAHVEKAGRDATEFTADFQAFITRYAWQEIWTRPGLPAETRRLLVLAFAIALGRWEEFDLHFRAAVQHGVSRAVLKEVLLQSAVYCGVPAANTAFHRAQAVLASLDAAGDSSQPGG
jgi:4-carboxymuconolactone decarboxylase